MANDSVTETFAQLVKHIAHGFLRGEISLAELAALKAKEIEIIFMLGHYLYNYGKYEEALSIFGTLTLYKPFVSRYWRAAGAANQALKRFDEAATAYDMALATNLGDVISYTYRGETRLALGNIEAGLEDLRMAVEAGENDPYYAQWVNRARTLLKVREKSEQ